MGRKVLLCAFVAAIALAAGDGKACEARDALDGRVLRVTDEGEIEIEGGQRLLLAGVETDPLTLPYLLPPLRAGLPAGAPVLYVARAAQADRWGRLPVELFLPPETAGPPDWVQEAVFAKGFARRRPSGIAPACRKAAQDAEDIARKTGAGLWSNADLGIISSKDTARLLGLAGRRILVEGKIFTLGQGRATIFLNFSPKRYDGFTVIVSKRREKAFTASGRAPATLVGRIVRVRGVLLDGRQPRLAIDAPEDLELVEQE